jgi:uncharacterized RDD family membrane protein YckC
MSSGLIALAGISPTLVVAVALAMAFLLLVLFVLAPTLAVRLLRFTARKLPSALSERLLEEWLAEVHAVEHRFSKLTFALALALAPTKSLVQDADETALAAVPILMDFADVKVPADFSIRLWAVILDMAIAYAAMLPIRWLGSGPNGSWTSDLVGMLWFVAMNVYFVQRFSGSPGKLLAKLRIVTMDGSRLTYKHTFLRVAPGFFLSLIGTLAFTLMLPMTMVEFRALPPQAQQQVMRALTTRSFYLIWGLLLTGWALADFIAFFVGYDRRPLHDRVAGTMVVHKIPAIPGPPYKLERPVW